MANETNQPQMPDDAPDHTVQDTAEFHEGGQQQEQQRQPAKKEEADEPAGEKTYFVDQNRANILASARAKKAETAQEFTGSDSDPKVRYGNTVDESDLGPLEQEALQRQREVRAAQFGENGQDDQGQQQQQDDTGQQQQQRPLNGMDPNLLKQQVKIVVNGQEQIITVEEALRRTQKIAAADDYFTQAKDTLHEVKQYRQEQDRRANQRDERPDGDQRDDQNYDDRGDRRNTTDEPLISLEDAEKIQMGTTEEVQATFAKLLKGRGEAVPQVDVAQEVRNALEVERTKTDVQAYAQKYTKEFSDPRFARTIAEFSQEAIIEDIIKSGISEDQFNSVLTTPELVKEFHRQARQRNMPGFRTPLQLTQAGHKKAVEWRTGKPFVPAQQQQQQDNPPLNMQQRQERKAQLQQQPQQRRQAPANLSQQNKTQDQGRSGRFEAIKKARGQPV